MAHAVQDVRFQLVDNQEDHRLYQQLQQQLLEIEKRQQEGRAVLPFLEAYLLNVACDDPGVIIGPHLVLLLLQQRLSDKALEYHRHILYHTQQEVCWLRICSPTYLAWCLAPSPVGHTAGIS